jgi:hypothetical protein
MFDVKQVIYTSHRNRYVLSCFCVRQTWNKSPDHEESVAEASRRKTMTSGTLSFFKSEQKYKTVTECVENAGPFSFPGLEL